MPGQRDGLPDHRDGLPAQRDCFGGRTTWDSLAAIADLGEAEEYLRLFHTECPRAAGRLAPRLAQVRQEIELTPLADRVCV